MKLPIPIAAAAVAVLGASMPLFAQGQGSGTVTLNISGLNSTSGQLIVCLFDEQRDFPECEEGDGTFLRRFAIAGTATRINMPLPAAGTYAVTVFHDENGNGRLGQNFLGMPTEGVGVSGNPGGIPRYSRSQISLEPGSTVNITMRYLFD